MLLALGIAVSNTPARVDRYAVRIPVLRFLRNNESVMTEFGHRHVDPEIGVFFPPDPAELLRIDRERGAEVGESSCATEPWNRRGVSEDLHGLGRSVPA